MIYRKLFFVISALLLLTVTAACTPDSTPTATPADPPPTTAAENPAASPTAVPPTATLAPTPVPATATAVPPIEELTATVQAELPQNAYDGVEVLSLEVGEGERPLWAVYSAGFRNYDLAPPPHHFLALYTYQDGAWQEAARQDLNPDTEETNYVSPDIIPEGDVQQVEITPDAVWLTVDGGVGAHGGTFQLLRFAGESLEIETAASNASPGVGYLEDLNGDGTPEVILRLHDHYVFCYACGVRYLNFAVHVWNPAAEQTEQVRIEPLPAALQDHPAYETINRAVELAEAGLWPDALAKIEEAGAAAEPADPPALAWNADLIRFYHDAWQEEVAASPYPLLSNIFFGDYAAALEIVRAHPPEQIFTSPSPLIEGTVAEGNEQWMADYILEQTNAAIAAQPDLASAYYFRAWATFLHNPAAPQIESDLAQAAALAPNEPLFAEASAPAANRIQFEPGATSARVTGELAPGEVDTYVLRAQAGQRMTADVFNAENASLSVRAEDGEWLEGQVNPTLWMGELPETGDYVIRVSAGDVASDYTLNVNIPARIEFAPGATSATMQGDLAAHESHDYVLRAQEGQTMDVTIASPNGDVLLTIVGDDGIPLTNGLMSGATSWRGQLPATQDYTLRALAPLEASSYTLEVSIE